jgi:hypothetical protein
MRILEKTRKFFQTMELPSKENQKEIVDLVGVKSIGVVKM